MVAKVVPQGKEEKAFILPRDHSILSKDGFELLGVEEREELTGNLGHSVWGNENGFSIIGRTTHAADLGIRVNTEGVDWGTGKEGGAIRNQIHEPEGDRPYWELVEGTRIEPISPHEAEVFRSQKER